MISISDNFSINSVSGLIGVRGIPSKVRYMTMKCREQTRYNMKSFMTELSAGGKRFESTIHN